MAWTYRLGIWRRLVNRIVCALLRLGVGPPHTYLLTVRGRNSGRAYSTPVTLVAEGSNRWLVAPYGEVNWVRNAREAGKIILSRGRQREAAKLTELPPDEAAPVLKKYFIQVAVTRPFFDVTAQSSLAEFIAEAPKHPVFLIGIIGPGCA